MALVPQVHAQNSNADTSIVEVKPQTEPATAPPPEVKPEAKPEPTPQKPFDLRTSRYLTGEWGGKRSEWKEKGISLDLSYNQQFQQNFKGGLETHNADAFSGSYDFDIALDFGKMGWLDDSGFFIRAAKGTWGEGINPDVGALFNPNSDAAGDQSIYVNKWWVWKKFADKKLELRLGLLETAKDLIDVSLYANHEDKDFLNRLSIRNPTIPHGTGNGAFLKYEPVPWFYAQIVTFNSDYQSRTTGWDTAFHGPAWFTTIGEVGFTPKWESEKGPMPGRYRIGGWYDPRSKTIFRDNLDGRLKSRHEDHDQGFYIGFDQMVWKENDDPKDTQGWGVFARYGYANADRNKIADAWEVGTSVKGLIPTRDADVAGFAVSQGMLSEQYRDEIDPLADRETVYELYYAYQLMPWLIISPDLQFITNPGGDTDDRDAIVGGVRVRVIF